MKNATSLWIPINQLVNNISSCFLLQKFPVQKECNEDAEFPSKKKKQKEARDLKSWASEKFAGKASSLRAPVPVESTDSAQNCPPDKKKRRRLWIRNVIYDATFLASSAKRLNRPSPMKYNALDFAKADFTSPKKKKKFDSPRE